MLLPVFMLIKQSTPWGDSRLPTVWGLQSRQAFLKIKSTKLKTEKWLFIQNEKGEVRRGQGKGAISKLKLSWLSQSELAPAAQENPSYTWGALCQALHVWSISVHFCSLSCGQLPSLPALLLRILQILCGLSGNPQLFFSVRLLHAPDFTLIP